MELDDIARQFAQQRGIYLHPYSSGIMGKDSSFTVARSLRGRREKLFVVKQFPPDQDIRESKIYVATTLGGDQGVFTLKVINGCLRDYLALLQGAQDNLSKVLYQSLYGYLRNEDKPFAVISQQLLGVTLKEVPEFLQHIYPC